MYSSYTTLQRVQLAKQEYLDTQEVFLGVYAPGRNAALKASLQDQLHRKFLLTDSLRPEALGSAAGVKNTSYSKNIRKMPKNGKNINCTEN